MTTIPMQTPDPKFNLETFFGRVRSAAARVLMLDYDGTLAPFRINPAEAAPYPGVIPLLDEIQQSGHTRVVMVSGRWTKDLVPLLGLKRAPEIWGSHGWERLQPHGEYNVGRITPSALEVLVTADEWIAEIEALGGRCERKPAALAFHWRGLDNARIAGIRDKIFEKWTEIGYVNGLAWHDFDGGIELRVAGRDKGDVVRTLVAEVGPGAVFAYLGDDLTDEPAFKAMPDTGAAILVRPQFRPTTAALWIRPPEELLEFLARWHRAAGNSL